MQGSSLQSLGIRAVSHAWLWDMALAPHQLAACDAGAAAHVFIASTPRFGRWSLPLYGKPSCSRLLVLSALLC